MRDHPLLLFVVLMVLPGFVGILVGLALFARMRRRLIPRLEAWRKTYEAAAARVGLTHIVGRKIGGRFVAIEGVADPFRVRIEICKRGNVDLGTRVTVSGSGQIPYELDLRAEGLASQMGKALGGNEIVVGDTDFDGEVYARGPEDVLRALCDTRTRALVRGVITMNGRVLQGYVCAEVKEVSSPAETLVGVLETALSLARCLVPRENVVQRIVELVRSDPVMGVRERCLGYLVRAYPEHPTVSVVIREALTMPSPELRVRAAIALGADGRETLLGLVGSPDLDTECAADGIRPLGEALPEERGLEILEDALRLTRRWVAQAAIEALGLSGTARAVPPLRAAIESHALDSGLRRKAQAAIARIQSRIEGAEAGQISITDAQADAGQLSLSDTASGRLSLDQPADEREGVSATRATETE